MTGGPKLSGLPLSGVLAALNHLLEQQSWARERMRAHAGRSVCIGVDTAFPLAPFVPRLHVRVDPHGLLARTDPADRDPADVSLWLMPSVAALFAGLRQGADGLSGHLRVEGDVLLAATLGDLARSLRWDSEEDLSRLLGDVGASRIASTVRDAGNRLARRRQLAGGSLNQWLTHEDPMLVDADRFAAWREELVVLRRRVDALDARLS